MKVQCTSIRWKKGFRRAAKHVTGLWPDSARRIHELWQSNCISFLLEGDILNSNVYVAIYIFVCRLTAVRYSLLYSVIPSAYTVVPLSDIDIFRVCLYSLRTAAVQDRTVVHMPPFSLFSTSSLKVVNDFWRHVFVVGSESNCINQEGNQPDMKNNMNRVCVSILKWLSKIRDLVWRETIIQDCSMTSRGKNKKYGRKLPTEPTQLWKQKNSQSGQISVMVGVNANGRQADFILKPKTT